MRLKLDRPPAEVTGSSLPNYPLTAELVVRNFDDARLIQFDNLRVERILNNVVHFGSSSTEEVTVYAYGAPDSQSLWLVQAGENVVSQHWVRQWRKIPLKGAGEVPEGEGSKHETW